MKNYRINEKKIKKITNIFEKIYTNKRDFSLKVKHMTFNHYNMGSNPIGLKKYIIVITNLNINLNKYLNQSI